MNAFDSELSYTEDEGDCSSREESFLKENEKIECITKEDKKEDWKVYFGF